MSSKHEFTPPSHFFSLPAVSCVSFPLSSLSLPTSFPLSFKYFPLTPTPSTATCISPSAFVSPLCPSLPPHSLKLRHPANIPADLCYNCYPVLHPSVATMAIWQGWGSMMKREPTHTHTQSELIHQSYHEEKNVLDWSKKPAETLLIIKLASPLLSNHCCFN